MCVELGDVIKSMKGRHNSESAAQKANINNDKEEEKDHNSFFKMPALRGTILYPRFYELS